jgi:hypothetical protein
VRKNIQQPAALLLFIEMGNHLHHWKMSPNHTIRDVLFSPNIPYQATLTVETAYNWDPIIPFEEIPDGFPV